MSSTRRRCVGRTYHEATDKPGASVAVISETIWKQQFGANPAVIGTQVRLNGAPTEIIGVVPEFLRHPQKSDVWMLSPFDVPTSPFGMVSNEGSRDVHYFSVVGRVARDRAVIEGRQQLKSIGDQIARDHQGNAGSTFNGEPLAASMVADVRTAMLVLLGAVGFVLADRVRKRRRPVDRPGCRAPARAGGAYRAGRRTRPLDAAVADRKHRARAGRRRAGHARRAYGRSSCCLGLRRRTCRGWPTSRSTGASRRSRSPPPSRSASCSG